MPALPSVFLTGDFILAILVRDAYEGNTNFILILITKLISLSLSLSLSLNKADSASVDD